MMKRFNFFLIILVFLSAFSACVTSKKKGDIGWAKRQFNNITTHYNYYFNANVLYEEAIEKLNLQHQDNFSTILDLYPEYSVEGAKAQVGEELDKAIKKVSIASTIHNPSDWVDNCYLLMGRSQFLKRDFETAEETFTFLTEEFTPNKIDRRPKSVKRKEAAAKKAKERKEAAETKAKEKKKATETKKKEQEKQKKEIAKTKKNKTKDKKKTTDNEIVKNTKEVKVDTKKEKEVVADENLLDPTVGSKNDAPKKYIIKHRPSYQDGQLWLAKTLIERQKYGDANEILLELLRNRSTLPDVRRDAAKTYAYFFMKQKDYNKAILPLEKAILLSNSRKDRARMNFILGQIHQEAGRTSDALMAFEKVLKSNTSYELEFNAKLNVILFSYQTGKSNFDDAVSTLKKMAKEKKNEDYLDQLYYTLAQVGFKNNDKKMAMENLQLSLNYSKKNQSQKAESYLQLAELYFQDEKYMKAKNYYDSCLAVLNKQDDRYNDVKRHAFGLTDIATSLEIIQTQDSLIKIAKLTPDERKELAKKMKKEQEAGLGALAAKDIIASGKNPATLFPSDAGNSSFFAYNPKKVQAGKRAFMKEWGDRKLEDDWRRSNKKSNTIDIASSDNSNNNKSNIRNSGEMTEGDIARMLQGVPNSPEGIEAANALINDAMMKLGKAYREALKKNEKSVSTLEALNVRFPGGKNELESWYYLYLAHMDLNQKPQAKEYYDKIIGKYPNTTYARVLNDPNFISEDEKIKIALNNYYKNTYDAFSKGQYKLAYDNSVKADSVFGKRNTFKPKFALLTAMSAGSIFGKDKYISLIKEVIAKFPETAEQRRAKEILRFLENSGVSAVSNSNGDENASDGSFKPEDDAVHYGIVVITNPKARLEEAKAKVGEFVREYFRTDNLKISNVFFGEESEIPLIVVRKFSDKAKGMEFISEVRRHDSDFITTESTYELYVISQNNYKELLKSKNTNVYKTFYAKYYLQN